MGFEKQFLCHASLLRLSVEQHHRHGSVSQERSQHSSRAEGITRRLQVSAPMRGREKRSCGNQYRNEDKELNTNRSPVQSTIREWSMAR